MVPITSSISMENLDSRTLDEQETCLEQKRSRRLERLLPMRRLGEYLVDLSHCPLHVVVDDDVSNSPGASGGSPPGNRPFGLMASREASARFSQRRRRSAIDG